MEERNDVGDNRDLICVRPHCRHIHWYRLVFGAPRKPGQTPQGPYLVLDVRLKNRGDSFEWHIERVPISQDKDKKLSPAEEAISIKLKDLFGLQAKGDGWKGAGHSIIAEPAGVQSALETIDEGAREAVGSRGAASNGDAGDSQTAPVVPTAKVQDPPVLKAAGQNRKPNTNKRPNNVIELD